MQASMVEVRTEDGMCDAYLARPQGSEEVPVVLFYMDAIGLRPRIFEMAERIASHGYLVLAPNYFYRSRRAPILDYGRMLLPENRPEMLREVMALASELKPAMSKRDVPCFLDFARSQPGVRREAGLVGYCMGGAQALRAASNFPAEFKGVASFHAGNLATDAETSPHRLFPALRAEVYIAHADKDGSMPPEQMDRVAAAMREIPVPHTIELYEGAMHGWTMKDLPAFNAAAEERHWNALFALLARTLRPAG